MCLIGAIDWDRTAGLGWQILTVALGLGFVIFVHELGHFLVAKMCGVKCEKFYVGFDVPLRFGPIALPSRFCRFQWGETEYGIGILPLGGYVKMLGQDDDPRNAQREAERIRVKREDTDGQEENSDASQEEPLELDPRSFPAKTVAQRMAIISAGVVMNLIFAVIFAAVAFSAGVPYTPCEIGTIVPGSPAWKAGIEPESKIIQIGKNGKRSERLRFRWDLSNNGVGLAQDKEDLDLLLRMPDGDEEWFAVRPVMVQMRKGRAPMIGVAPASTRTIGAIADASAAAVASPALKAGDRIVGVNGTPLESVFQFETILAAQPDQPLQLKVDRTKKENGVETTSTFETTLQPNPLLRFGVVMEFGPLVSIRPGSPAETAGLQAGDKLLSIDGSPITDPLALPAQVMPLYGKQVPIVVERSGEEVELSITPEQPQALEWTLSPGFPMATEALGVAYPVFSIVREVMPASPAEAEGIQTGDQIVGIRFAWTDGSKPRSELPMEGEPVVLQEMGLGWLFAFDWMQRSYDGMQIHLTVLHDGQNKEVLLTGQASDAFNPNRGILFQGKQEIYTATSFSEAVALGFMKTREDMVHVLRFLKKLVTGEVSATNLGGPISIARVAGAEASQGLPRLLIFLTLLSANLAILNFLPIPALDGGHMLFLTWEWIVGKPVDERAQMALTVAGVAGLLGLMLFVFGLDIDRWFL